MADQRAKRDFSDILKNLKRKFDITDCKWTEDRFFEIKFRTHIGVEHNDYNTYCDNWADQFSEVTDTVWVHKISNTGPKVKFRKQYQCWTYEDKEVQKELLFDARRCKGTLDIKILGDTTGAKKTNKYMKLGLNAVIKINFHHLHSVDLTQENSFFVHKCEPQPEPPKPVVQSNGRISELIAKMVENASVTSQKAAERAQEALKRQCIVPEGGIHSLQQAQLESAQNIQQSQTDIPLSQNVSYDQQSLNTLSEKFEPTVAQVLVNSDGQATETYYVQQVVFDSTTQTLQHVIPVTGGTVPTLSGHQLIHVPMSQTNHILEIPHQLQNGDGQGIIQNY